MTTGNQASGPYSVAYRLAVTVVRIRGTRTRTTSELDGPGAEPRVEREATIDLDVVADAGAVYEIVLPAAADWADRQLSLVLEADGRLSSAGGAVTDRSGERLKAVVTVGAAVAGGLLALGASPLVGAAAGLSAAVGGVALLSRKGIAELDRSGYAGSGIDEASGDSSVSAEDLGIRPEFKVEHRADFELLYAYRRSLIELTAAHASTALGPATPATKAEQLKGFDAVLRSTRAEARLVEARYDAWLRSKELATVDTVDLWLSPAELPDEATLKAELRERDATHTEPWWEAATTLRTMVSIDYLDDAGPPSDKASLAGAVPVGCLVYRPPRPAVLGTWRLERTDATGWKAVLVRQDRIMVTVPGSERTVAIIGPRGAKVDVGIDPTGALTSLAVTAQSARADRAATVAGLPGALQAGLASGTAVGGAFNAKAVELERLKRQVEIAEVRAKLKGPADPDPRLAELREKLAVADLEARLSAADLVRANPATATLIVRVDGSPAS